MCMLTRSLICTGHFSKADLSSSRLSGCGIGSVTPWWRLASVLFPPTAEWCFALEMTKATHRVALAGRDSDAVC